VNWTLHGSGYVDHADPLIRGLVPFQISPHYLDRDPSYTHMGEMQEERIMQFLEENEETVVGLREGSILRIQEGASQRTRSNQS
jgi:peptidase E